MIVEYRVTRAQMKARDKNVSVSRSHGRAPIKREIGVLLSMLRKIL